MTTRGIVCWLWAVAIGCAPAAPSGTASAPLLAADGWSEPDRAGDVRDLSWSDFDADGDLDLAVADHAAGLRIYRNDSGVLLLHAEADLIGVEAVVWGDLDPPEGTGHPSVELVAGGDGVDGVGQLVIYDLSGEGLAIRRALDGWADVNDLALGDLTGDGLLDLVVARDGAASAALRGEDGAFSETPLWIDTVDDVPFVAVALADHDGDGDLDVALGPYEGVEGVRLLWNTDAAGQLVEVWSAQDGAGARDLAWADVDEDGDLDLVSASEAGGRLYVNAGEGFEAGQGFGEARPFDAVALGDLNGKGALDVLLADPEEVQVYLGGGIEWADEPLSRISLTEERYFDETAPVGALALADFDSDGLLDLAAAGGDDGSVIIRASVSRGMERGWVGSELLSAAQHGTVAWGDWNGDGRLDLLTAQPGETRVYPQGAQGLEENPAWSSSAEPGDDPGGSAIWLDVDGDGDLDVARSAIDDNPYDGEAGVDVFLNSGAGLGLQPSATWAPGPEPGHIAAGDWDLDGDVDLLVPRSGRLDTLLNDGLGGFDEILSSEAPEGAAGPIAVADFDLDGDLDVAVEFVGLGLRVWANTDGKVEPLIDLAGGDVSALHWVNADGDEDLDLAVAHRDGPFVVHETLSGVPQHTSLWTGPSGVSAAAFEDWDHDGDLDLALGLEADGLELWTAEGAGWTRGWGAGLGVGRPTDLSWADVDGDGDTDLAVFRELARPAVYLNHLRRADVLPDGRGGVVFDPLFSDALAPGGSGSLGTLIAEVHAVGYRVLDEAGDTASRVRLEFSDDGGATWAEASTGTAESGRVNLAGSPEGYEHSIQWIVPGGHFHHARLRLVVESQISRRIGGIARHSRVVGMSPVFRAAHSCFGDAVGRDNDGDGYFTCGTDAPDCADADPARHPGAIELCDEADLDCDGVLGVDQIDLDGDGGCLGDCDDTDATVGAAAEEICGDGVDQDCDGTEESGRDDPECWEDGCSCSAAPASGLAGLAGLVLPLVFRRRRRVGGDRGRG